jgi:uncharacterized protein with HEPN domain
MREAAEEILQFVQGRTFEDFRRDRQLAHATVRCLEIIGEAAARISEETKSASPSIPWPHLIGMRNRLIHAYFSINFEVVWKTVQEDVPILLEKLTMIASQNSLESDREYFYKSCQNIPCINDFKYNPKSKNCLYLSKKKYKKFVVTWIILAKNAGGKSEYKIQMKFEKAGKLEAEKALAIVRPYIDKNFKLELKPEDTIDGYLEYHGKYNTTFSLNKPKTWEAAIADIANAYEHFEKLANDYL